MNINRNNIQDDKNSPIEISITETSAEGSYSSENISPNTSESETAEEEPTESNGDTSLNPPQRKHHWKLWATIFSALFLGFFAANKLPNPSVENSSEQIGKPISTSEGAQEILKQRWSNKLELGARLVQNDDQIRLEPADLTLKHDKKDQTTKIWIWDFAAEDGDYVQIKVDGKIITEPFMIMNQAVSFEVPAESKIEVIGVKDGGGGITYAIHHEIRGETYLNGMNVGGSNTYILERVDSLD